MHQNKLRTITWILCLFLCGCRYFGRDEQTAHFLAGGDAEFEKECHLLIRQWLSIKINEPRGEVNRATFNLVGGSISRMECFRRLAALTKTAPEALHVSLGKR
jgi:hypothetical protein